MRVLVTGGAGFIGSHIVDQLLGSGHEVAIVDDMSRGTRALIRPGVHLYQVDIRDASRLKLAFADFRPEAVSHQAAQISVPESFARPAWDAEVNVVGSQNVAQAAIECGARRFVFASSGGALGGDVPDGKRWKASDGLFLESPYAVHKAAFESQLVLYEKMGALEVSVLRYANVYGPRQAPEGEAGVVAIFFERALLGKPLRIFGRRRAGDSGCERDYVFVLDVARANRQALESKVNSPISVATGVGTTTLDLARAIRELTGGISEIEFAAPRLGDVQRSVLDPTMCESEFGKPTALGAGLLETFQYFKNRKPS